MAHGVTGKSTCNGFTLVELAVVSVIIGAVAAFAVPRFIKVVERSKAAEGFAYLAAVSSAQEHYQAREGTYADMLSKLNINRIVPRYFTVGTMTVSEESWTLTLIRKANASGFGQYTVTFTQMGLDPSSTIADADHQDINPMAN